MGKKVIAWNQVQRSWSLNIGDLVGLEWYANGPGIGALNHYLKSAGLELGGLSPVETDEENRIDYWEVVKMSPIKPIE